METVWLTVNESSAMFGVPSHYIAAVARKGKIKSRPATAEEIALHKHGKGHIYVMLDQDSVEKWVAGHACSKKPQPTSKPVKAKPVKVKPVKAKPVKVKPVKAKPVKVKPAKPKAQTVSLRDRIKYVMKGVDYKLKTIEEAFADIAKIVDQEPNVSGWNPL
jgi:hypothetical protein